jgi:hypothetical protein
MTDKEAMAMALDALVQMKAKANFECWNLDVCDEAIAALKERLALPEQEPVAEIVSDVNGHLSTRWSDEWTPDDGDKLYTHPPQRTEQNFCSRCGKRTKDLTHIHTCTPPKD